MVVEPVHLSVTRISDLETRPYDVQQLGRPDWATGDYVMAEVTSNASGSVKIERTDGRMAVVFPGDRVVGALGDRFATLELTGSWQAIDGNGRLDILTAGGLISRVTSASWFVTQPIAGQYLGHVVRNGQKVTMRGSVPPAPDAAFTMPVVLIIGTSMSAGKTTTARVVVTQLRELGHEVMGAKLAGAGRYRDILTMKDGGAQHIMDFVDVGLPSTVVPETDFRQATAELLARMGAIDADVAVIEAGASPMEPYNGGVAVEMFDSNVKMTILAASDPYAVLGIQEAFGRTPDLVTGPAANTLAGVQLVERLTGVPALNVQAPTSAGKLRAMLEERFG